MCWYFDDSNVPKCSSHLCCTGYNFAPHSLLTSSLHIHTVTLKYVCASAASYPNNVYFSPELSPWVPRDKKITEVLARHPATNFVMAKSNMAAVDHDANNIRHLSDTVLRHSYMFGPTLLM